MSTTQVRDLFAADPSRFDKMHLKFEDLLQKLCCRRDHEINTNLPKNQMLLPRRKKCIRVLKLTKLKVGQYYMYLALRNQSNTTPIYVDWERCNARGE